MVERRRLLLAATVAATPFLTAQAQTIRQHGKAVEATASNVAPAGEPIGEEFVLTDAAVSNLTKHGLSNAELFQFPAESSRGARSLYDHFPKCKITTRDRAWPQKVVWKIFDLLTGGALIKTVPLGAACYEGEHYDASECDYLLKNWTNPDLHWMHPTSPMSPLYAGAGCLPEDAAPGAKCEIGGLPEYTVKATNIAQIQLAVNFARNLNMRLVIRNTGHDFLGKSTGASSLSIWTHNMKELKFIKNYKTSSGSYRGAAFKIGAGIQVAELYQAADKYGYTAVGGECHSVGVAGGYTAGGGHSPISPIAGMGADQVLSVDIVLPDGRFITADERNHPDVYWAVRGGGASTFGVVTSMTVRVWPKMKFAGASWSITMADTNLTADTFWAGMRAYWRRFPEFSDKKTYAYSILSGFNGSYSWSMAPWLVPNTDEKGLAKILKPLLEEWDEMGFHVTPSYYSTDNFYDAWADHFPADSVGTATVRTGSRLISRKNWEDPKLLERTMDAVQGVVEDGSVLILYNINGAAPKGTPDSATNPAWRDAVFYGIIGSGWSFDSSPSDILAINKKITNDWMERLREVSPGSGGYGNEGDVEEPNFGQAFYGAEHYKRLYQIKQDLDPWGVFYAPTAVGSEDWFISPLDGLLDGLKYGDILKTLSTFVELQTGRLCRK